ncbi:SAM-dependent methyltransferase [Thermobispora bispora]|uniref:SAM-dependent methyltransferase n=1 Tax=Thermobispora bispora TaxID=2006 RepID=UPI0019814BFA|nr:SAM-dependent methyltransferase [Thermobispora bispora]QSI50014.1 hypothetical protein CYL17_18760 [Thermobispora bispora]
MTTPPTGPGIDAQRPSPARMYDYFLGGEQNFAVDRAAADRVIAVTPHTKDTAVANRQFLIEAVRYVARQGVTQFLDLGSGLPTQQNVHQVAQSVHPHAHTVYVDNDPAVLPHAQALIVGDPNTTYIEADIRDPVKILTHPETTRLIDFTQPVALLMVAILHFIGDQDDPRGLVDRFLRDLPSGSYLILSHVTTDGIDPTLWETVQATNPSLAVPLTFRPGDEIRKYFDGLELVDPPGIVDCRQWQPGELKPLPGDVKLRIWAGVARKP